MKKRETGPGLAYDCNIIDIRDLDTEPLLECPSPEDNVLAILTRPGTNREALKRILARIAASAPAERGAALADLMTLAGLRELEDVIEEEIEQMPILDDIMDHKVLGRERKRGMELGGAEGQRGLILGLLSRRFGPVPDWAVKHLDSLSTAELEPIALRLLDAQSIEDLLGQP